jgi:cytochrome b subunit of formate dehydrogenase
MKFWIIFARVLAVATLIATGVLLWRVNPLLTLCLATFIGCVMLEGVAQEGMR